jgi:hypothetical protein
MTALVWLGIGALLTGLAVLVGAAIAKTRSSRRPVRRFLDVGAMIGGGLAIVYTVGGGIVSYIRVGDPAPVGEGIIGGWSLIVCLSLLLGLLSG